MGGAPSVAKRWFYVGNLDAAGVVPLGVVREASLRDARPDR